MCSGTETLLVRSQPLNQLTRRRFAGSAASGSIASGDREPARRGQLGKGRQDDALLPKPVDGAAEHALIDEVGGQQRGGDYGLGHASAQARSGGAVDGSVGSDERLDAALGAADHRP